MTHPMRPFLLCCLMLASTTSFAQYSVVRRHINFDEDWKFHPGHATDPHRDFNYGIANILAKTGETVNTCLNPDYDDRSWTGVQLPHDWVVGLPFVNVSNGDVDAHGYKPVGGLFPENSVGWYRKSFMLEHADSGNRFVLQFDGIFRDSKVWVNGIYMGGHFSGYSGVSFDITDFLHFGGRKNVVVVRADASQFEGWFYEGAGIYRHTWLNMYDNLHIAPQGGVFVHAEYSQGRAAVTIETKTQNHHIRAADGAVYTYITDRDGKRLVQGKEESLSLAVNAEGAVRQVLSLDAPVLWSLENPYLYRAVAVVLSGGRAVDSMTVRFGVRTITVDKDKGLFLNGKPLKIQGVCCHQDHAGVGSALPDYLQYYRIGLLKEMGVNAYRSSHNAPTPELLDACDSLGMLVLDETRLLNSGEEYGTGWEQQILRDRNHPSVFMWSIGNEEWKIQESDIGKRIAQHQILKQQELDPTRTSTYAANIGNVWRGVNQVIPVRGFNYNLYGLDAYRKEHPDQPIMGTETASTVTSRGIFRKDTVNGYVPDYDSVYPSWASTAEQWWTIAANREWFMGGFAWTGFDYRGEPTPYRWPDINSNFGIMDMCGFPKTVYYYYQSWWTDKDVLHIAPHWNWKDREGQPIAVWVNSNAENVELFLNGKSLGKKDMPRQGHLEWMVNYAPGKLQAVGYKHGKKLVAVVETTGSPVKIVITPSKNTLLADGRDAAVFNISAVDARGMEVPDAGDLVHFTVSRGAKIIGVGNGDPSSHEPDKYPGTGWQRRLFNGHCQVIVQSEKGSGGSAGGSGSGKTEVVLEATGDGLQGAIAGVRVVQQ
jgi:beta-galactosidase